MDDGSERALARYRVTLRDGTCAETVVALPPAQIEQPASTDRNHTTQDIARVADLLLDLDTLEGRAVRAEQAATVALTRAQQSERRLDSVRMALRLERVPRLADDGSATLTVMGRVRLLGDRARRAERERDALRRELKRLREEFKAPGRGVLTVKGHPLTVDGQQLTVDDCIAEVERDADEESRLGRGDWNRDDK